MSTYKHELRKASDLGLQLRLPVDLIPPGQYGRLTNALPLIEGELRTRDGVSIVEQLNQVSYVYQLGRANVGTNLVTTIYTVYPCGLRPGDPVTINVIALNPTEASSVTLGTYNDVIAGVAYPETIVTLSTGFTATWSGTNLTMLVFAEITSLTTVNNLPNTVVNNIYRLNQALTNIVSDRLFSIGPRLWHQQLTTNGSFEELVPPIWPSGSNPVLKASLSGRPLSIITFRFTLDQQAWAIIADQGQMLKYRSASTLTGIELVPLGNAPPTAPATASAGGAGNLNSSGGTGYDWRYTYVDGFALTESNPSPINQTSGAAGENPTAHSSTGFSGVTNTAGSGTVSVSSPPSPASGSATCTWSSFTVPGGTISAQTLTVTFTASGNASSSTNSGVNGQVTLSYACAGGGPSGTLYTQSTGSGNGFNAPNDPFNYSGSVAVTIPSSVSPANLSITATVSASSGAAPGANSSGAYTLNVTNIVLTCNFVSAVNALSLTNQSANVCVTPPTSGWQKFINLYRRGGSLTDAWRLVGQFQVSSLSAGGCGGGTLQINDNVSDTTLSTAAILQLDNDQPVTSVVRTAQPLSFIWGPTGTDARVLGCGDPARPESVYFSKPGNADAWPPQNHVEVCDPGTPVIAGCIYNTRNFAFSQEAIYELVQGLGNGATYTPFRTPASRGLFCPQGLAVGPAVFFISKDGIYATEGGVETSIVENDIKPLFPTYDSPGQQVESYEAVDYTQPDSMRLRYHSNELYFIYAGATTGRRQTLVYDVLKHRWRAANYTAAISEFYSEPTTANSLLLGTVGGNIYQAGGNYDPAEPDLLVGVGISVVAQASTFASASYNFRVTALSSFGEVALSYETQDLAMDATKSIQVQFPIAQPGIIGWRVYNGQIATTENQYASFTEAQVALLPNRVATITTPAGTPGSIPVVTANRNIAVAIRTGANDQGAPLNKKQYGNVIFDIDPGGATTTFPVTITPYVNGEAQAQAALVVTGSGRQQVPLSLSDYFAFNTEYEITWQRALQNGRNIDPVIFQYDTLHFLEPAELTHWRSQASSFGFPGWMHCRDAYIAIRSTVATTLTVTFDIGNGTEVAQTYTIPSTSGQRLKQYVQFSPNKGLLYRFTLDTNGPGSFRIYESDLEIRVKPWLGLLGYSTQRPLGGESA